ncbi:MAG TPA: hypothetical protein VL498_06870 [Terracidiphilus sp.]|jgi:hypothetical protein|nr:hypothetical protein [Terracidiphilus sp.]
MNRAELRKKAFEIAAGLIKDLLEFQTMVVHHLHVKEAYFDRRRKREERQT